MEFGNVLPYDINIKGSSNKGFIVKTGCSTCVFTDAEEMLKAIDEYIKNPKGLEEEYNKSNQCPSDSPIAYNVNNNMLQMATTQECCQDEAPPNRT